MRRRLSSGPYCSAVQRPATGGRAGKGRPIGPVRARSEGRREMNVTALLAQYGAARIESVHATVTPARPPPTPPQQTFRALI